MALRLAVVALCVLASISTSALAATAPPPPSMLAQQLASALVIEQSLLTAGLFNTTANLLNVTTLAFALGSSANVTLLAPSDDAWRNILKQPRGADLVQAFEGPNAALALINLLLYHTIPAYYTSVTLLATTSDSPLPTLLGDSIFVSTAIGQTLFYSNITNKKDVATVFAPDLYTDYLVSIQGIDRVLIPKNISLLFNPETLLPIPLAPAPLGAPTAAPAGTGVAAAAPAPAPKPASTAGSPPSTAGSPPSTAGSPPSTAGSPPSTAGSPPSTAGSPPTASASRTPPSAFPSSGNTTSPSTPSTTSSAGFVAVNALATFAALFVSVAALL